MRSWCGHSRERTCSNGAISGMCVWLWQDIRKLQAEKCYEINNFVQDCSISASMYFLLCDSHLYVKIDLAQPNFRPNLIFLLDNPNQPTGCPISNSSINYKASWNQAPVPLMIFRLNSKFDQNMQCSGLKRIQSSTMTFCTRHDSTTVVACAKYRRDRLSIL